MPDPSPTYARCAVALALMEDGTAFAMLHVLDEAGTRLDQRVKRFTSSHESAWQTVEEVSRILGAWVELGELWALDKAAELGWR